MVAKDITAALQSRKLADRLFDWRPQDCPGTDDKKKVKILFCPYMCYQI